jgi:integrase
MFRLNEFLTFDSKSAYVFAYDLPMKKNFSTPKIYTASGDLKKRWYVYFSFRDPKTGKLKRVTPFYGEANKYKTKEDRLYVLSAYRKKILELLKEGFNPYEDNTELYKKWQKDKNTKEPEQKVEKVTKVKKVKDKPAPKKAKKEKVEAPKMTVKEGFDYALNLKKNIIGEKSRMNYRSRANRFLRWLKKTHPKLKTVDQLTKRVLQEFLNEILTTSSPRNRNNYRVELSSLMQVLEDNEIIATNYLKTIPVLKAPPKRNKTYSKQVQEEIYKFLEEEDPHLLLFVKFISYNFLRPIEVCRIKIKDINLEQKTITFKAKNKPRKIKIIPDLLFKELPDLSKFNQEEYLFGRKQIGVKWDATEENKRVYFTKRYKKVVKEHFNLNEDYGLYSFRHTFITKLYRQLRKTKSPYEAKSDLMLITGHSTMTALEKYLRDIDAELPEDYSKLLK